MPKKSASNLLVDGMAGVLNSGSRMEPDSVRDLLTQYAINTGRSMERILSPSSDTARSANTLHMGEVGKPCMRQLWYKIYTPSLAEPLPPNVRLKFHYGDVIESAVIALVKASGRSVTAEQQRVEIPLKDGWKVSGRIDLVIDGELYDIKSCTGYAYNKYVSGTWEKSDDFGYKMQLTGYGAALGLTKAKLLVVNKENGMFTTTPPVNLESRDWYIGECDKLVDYVSGPTTPPPRYSWATDVPKWKVHTHATVSDRVLSTTCSYCEFKKECWKTANKYSGLHKYFTKSSVPYYTVLAEDDGV